MELKLPRFAFDPQEYERVAVCDGDARDELFFRYWVLKESFMKATGEGLSLPPSSFRVELDPPIRVIQDGALQDFGFQEGALPGYRHAVCLKGALPGEIPLETVDLQTEYTLTDR